MQNTKILSINKYNRNKAVTYAIEYALTRNSNYYDFSTEGGNCTNYISHAFLPVRHK